MQSECLSFNQIPNASKLFLEYLSYLPSVRDFYPYSPNIREWAKQAADKIEYPADRRQKVSDILKRQNQAWGASPKTLENIERIRQGHAAVVTGQQVGLLGGPFFSILKALTAVRLSEEAMQAGVPCVPVFWLATEDHDLDEVNHTFIPNSDGALHKLATSSKGAEDALVGSVPLDESFAPVLEETLKLLGEGPTGELVKNSYRVGETFGNAFAKLMTGLFADWGVILLDAQDPELRKVAQPLYTKAIEDRDQLVTALLHRGSELEAAGFHQQVKVTENTVPLFDIKTGQRIPIQKSKDGFTIAGEKISAEDLIRRTQQQPETFSPSVLLRPVVQDYLLPTLAYTGGPAEVAYFAQVGVVHEHLLGKVTPVLPRFSVTILEPKVQRILKKYEMKLQEVFEGPEHVRQLLASRKLPGELQATFEKASNAMDQAMDSICGLLEKLDPTLVDAAKNAKSKMQHQIEQLHQRAARAELRRNEEIQRHADILSNHLYPEKNLQEREIAGIYFVAQQGSDFLQDLYRSTEPCCPDHKVISI